jgi:hypothetical protein
VITVQAVDDLALAPQGRQWTSKQYQDRDAVLAALGVPAFQKIPRKHMGKQ